MNKTIRVVAAIAIMSATTPAKAADEPPSSLGRGVEVSLQLVMGNIEGAEPPVSLSVPVVAAQKEEKPQEAAEKPAPSNPATQKKVLPSPAKSHDSSVTVIGKSDEQCVRYVQRMRGDRKAHGYAGNLVPEGQEPRVGSIALERGYGHVSLVVALEGDYVILNDTNWLKGYITQRRVHRSSQRGYIY